MGWNRTEQNEARSCSHEEATIDQADFELVNSTCTGYSQSTATFYFHSPVGTYI